MQHTKKKSKNVNNERGTVWNAVRAASRQEMTRIQTAEMLFLRAVAGYRLIDIKYSKGVREELRMFFLSTKVKEY
jgi:hypothetical protein